MSKHTAQGRGGPRDVHHRMAQGRGNHVVHQTACFGMAPVRGWTGRRMCKRSPKVHGPSAAALNGAQLP